MPTLMTTEAATQIAPSGTTTRWTQMPKKILKYCGTAMIPVGYKSATCQTKVLFDNSEIPPGAPRPTLPWGYGYQQFDSLLAAYPEVHPDDFVTFGILQKQPRRGTIRDWAKSSRFWRT